MKNRPIALWLFLLFLVAQTAIGQMRDFQGLGDSAPAPTELDPIFPPEDKSVLEGAWRASVAAMRDLFIERSRRAPLPPRSAEAVRAAIDETFGVSKLGSGLRIIRRHERHPEFPEVSKIEFNFGERGYGEALIGVPSVRNGTLVIALHGCGGTPDGVMLDSRDYNNAFGRKAVERGYVVVAPYVMSRCAWINNLDAIAELSGVSVFGYEIAKIVQLAAWAQAAYDSDHVVIWGISLGGQYSMLSSAFRPELFDVTVISGAAADYELSYRRSFEAIGLDEEKFLAAGRQVSLSSRFFRHDVVASILPRPIIFEVSSADARKDSLAFIEYVQQRSREMGGVVKVVHFGGIHETAPELTLEAIDEVLLRDRRPCPR
jgi:predicted alpha/beta-fold hydrolase